MRARAVIPAPNRHLFLDPEHVVDLLHLLGLLDEVLRHGGYELRGDIADRYTSTTLPQLLDELDTQTSLLRRFLTQTNHIGQIDKETSE